jgi:NADH:ubiquinone oxidoreductase subunit 3 (subunit A)
MYDILLTFKFTIAFFFFGTLLLVIGFRFNWFYSILDFEKNSVYECGFEGFFSNSNLKNYDIEFLIFAILFLVLDLELILLLP